MFHTLSWLELDGNLLTGTIPPELGNIPMLYGLVMNYNQLTGGIPSTFASLTQLTEFMAAGNKLSGPLPDFMGTWTNLQLLVIDDNAFTGPLPASFANLNPEWVILAANQLSGPLPDFLTTTWTKMTCVPLCGCRDFSSICSFVHARAVVRVRVCAAFSRCSTTSSVGRCRRNRWRACRT